MKRSFVDTDLSPNQAAMSTFFDLSPRQNAYHVCQGRVEATGWIEGTVYDRGTVSDESWSFLIMTGGYRAHILLSGTISKEIGRLPISTGTQVRFGLKGLLLEDLKEASKISLPRALAWRNGVILHLKSKTGEEVFLDTFDDRDADTPATISSGVIPTPEGANQKRRKGTPTPVSSSPHEVTVASMSVHDKALVCPNVPDATVVQLINANINSSEGVSAKGVVESALGDHEVVITGTDPVNPQSLPSPPPENHNLKHLDEHNTNTEPVLKSNRTARPPPSLRANDDMPDNPTHTSPVAKASERISHAIPPTLSVKELKRLRDKQRKSEKKQKAATHAAQDGVQGEKDAVDSDEEYWHNADHDDIPEHSPAFETREEEETSIKHRLPVDLLESAPTVAMQQPREAHEPMIGLQVSDNDQHINLGGEPKSYSQGSASHEAVDAADLLRTGCVATVGRYTTLIEFEGTRAHHIMGIAHSSGTISQTRKSEFMMRLSLFDPSNYATNGLNVILFEKSENTLPKPEAGDVLLLRNIPGDMNDDKTAMGASYKGWQWAVFHVKTGMFSANLNPTASLRQFRPENSETQYCIRFSDWWREISARTISFGDEPPVATTSNGRPHSLFSEVQAGAYFDCTVEVLHGNLNTHNPNIYTVYVTDYTHNQHVAPSQAAWCPPQLAEVVLLVELSDDCVAIGETMQAGEYYSMRNMRLKVSGDGYLEGRLREGKKIQKLSEDELENQPHLIELLKRKKMWEANGKTAISEFPHQLIKDATENHHFNCTVEVVHISPIGDNSYIYVTDYTGRPDLVPVSPTIASEELADRVVRVALNDAQVDIAHNIAVGDFIAIRNLRLRPSGGSQLSGRLGGQQRLITKLNAKASSSVELKALLRRKEDFETAQLAQPKRKKGRTVRHKVVPADVKDPKASSFQLAERPSKKKDTTENGTRYSSLSDVLASEATVAVSHVRARVVDFYPDDIRDCVVMCCVNCNQTIPKTRLRCTHCDDAMEDETFVRGFFHLYFRIEDEEGTTLDVSVSDERCSVLRDLVPDEVYEDDGAFDMLVARIKPLVGNLLNVHDGSAYRRPVAQDHQEDDAPLLELAIGSWTPEGGGGDGGSRAYMILKHVIAEENNG